MADDYWNFRRAPRPSDYGYTELGNIDLGHRPVVRNPDGSISTVRSMSANIDGSEVLMPTVSPDGRIWNDQEAIDNYLATGQHLGKFLTPEDATAAAQSIHDDQAITYSGSAPTSPYNNTFRPRGAPTAEPNAYVDSYNDWDLVHRGAMAPWGVYEKDGQTSAGFAWPSMITEPIEAGKRFLSPGGGFENLPNEQSTQDATTLLLSMYGGNALNPMARVPKNALAAETVKAEKKGLTGWHYSENSFDTFDPSKAQSGLTYAQGLHFLANKDATLAPEFGPYLYQAKIDASPNEVMNWSAPYDQQPEIVRNLMPKVGVPDRDRPYITDMHAAWREYSKETGLDDWQISQQLRDAGIKVVDHGGHYVVIDDAAPEIVHKWAGNTQLYSDTGKPSIMGAALSSMSEPKNAVAAGAVKAGEEPSLLGSALAGAQGEAPKRMYHGTHADFDKFRTDGIGPHFGTQSQANDFTSFPDELYQTNPKDGGRVLPVDLHINNPLQLHDLNDWQPKDIAKAMKRTGEFDGLLAAIDRIPNVQDQYEAIRNAIHMQGYDGISYPNRFEGRVGGETSYIATKPGTVKAAYTGDTLFSDNSPSLLGSALAGAQGERNGISWTQKLFDEAAAHPSAVKTNDGFVFTETPIGFKINSPYGEVGGQVYPERNTLQIGHISAEPEGQGHGTRLMQNLARYAADKGLKLVSDNSVSSKQQNVYNALMRRGYQIKENAVSGFGRIPRYEFDMESIPSVSQASQGERPWWER